MSLDIDDIVPILQQHLAPTVAQAIAKDLIAAEREVRESKPKTKAAKTRLVALVRGDAALQAAVAGGAFIVSVPDDETTATYSADALIQRLRTAVVAHNEAPKGRRKAKARIETWHQAFTHLRPKTLKESGSQIGVKQKGTPAEVVVLTTEEVKP